MKIFKAKKELVSYLNIKYSLSQNKCLGFVPTMGALHSGHLSLIQKAKSECETVIASIFVNPTQFNNTNDFEKYPNTLNSDLEKLQKLNCDIVYVPTTKDVYKSDAKAKEFNFGSLDENMEGACRPGHFNGMATVIEKFFNIIKPTKAFFGQKDLQQLQIVKYMVKKMNFKIEIISIPTVRENNGLAKSSRNKLLSENEKKEASIIYCCLNYCVKNKKRGIESLKLHIQNQFAKQKNIKLEYIEIVNINNMLPIKKFSQEGESAICIAANINSVRLIDNIIL